MLDIQEYLSPVGVELVVIPIFLIIHRPSHSFPSLMRAIIVPLLALAGGRATNVSCLDVLLRTPHCLSEGRDFIFEQSPFELSWPETREKRSVCYIILKVWDKERLGVEPLDKVFQAFVSPLG